MATNRIKDERHLRHVAKQTCACDVSEGASGARMPDVKPCIHETVQAHHIMFAEPSAMGLKSGDNWAVPLCAKHHRDLHEMGDEKLFWSLRGIDPMALAQQIYQETLDFRAEAPIVRVTLPNRGKVTRSTRLLGSKERE